MAKKKTLSEKGISIKTGGEKYIELEKLNFFQGKLKTISKEDFDDLKKSLIKSGIPIGFHVWKDSKGKFWIIDGHHRWLALKALKDEGYFIPPLPVNMVLAANKKEAARSVLISNAKYAHINQESISDFAIDFELGVDDFEFLDIPGIDLGNTESEPGEVNNTSKELNQEDFKDFDHQCPKCGFEWDDSAADSKLQKNTKEE